MEIALTQAYTRLLDHFNGQRYPEAEQLCRTILQAEPDHVDTINILGVIAQRYNRHDLAIDQFQQALAIDAQRTGLYYNLGVSLGQLARFAEAEAVLLQGLTIAPDDPTLLGYLGAIQNKLGKLDAAVASLQKAVANDQTNPQLHYNLGVVLTESNRPDQALASLQQAIAIKADFVEAHNNMGTILKAQNRLSAAIACYKKALVLQPDFPFALNDLGTIHSENNQLKEAINCYQKAIASKPDFLEALSNLGVAYKQVGELERAVATFEQALLLNANSAATLNNLGDALYEQNRLSEAAAYLKKALVINPNLAEAHYNLGNVYKDQGELYQAVASYQQAIACRPNYLNAFNNKLMTYNYIADFPQARYHAEICQYGEIIKSNSQRLSHPNTTANSRLPLRVGFVSADFRGHSVSYFLLAFFAAHDRKKFAFYCYSNATTLDKTSKQLKKLVARWRNIANKDDSVAKEMIRNDNIDILVDLSGLTKGHRLGLFANKPAPIQVTWLGYPNSTGLQAIDYRITDNIADPVGMTDQYYIEKLIRLPNSFLCYSPPDPAPAITPLPAHKNGYITFVSFNNLTKITTEVVKVWARILHMVPGSRLMIKYKTLQAANVQQRFIAIFAKESIPADRLLTAAFTPTVQEHLAMYGQVDIALDTFPYNGTTTTCEALWMGVPVVVLAGDRHGGRVGASLLNSVQMPELITDNLEGYIAKAVALANNPDHLTTMRHQMRDRLKASTLCDADGFAKNMQQAFFNMCQDDNSRQ